MLKVYIADDSKPVRLRLVELVTLLDRVSLVGESGDALTALNEIQKLKPDVAILDIQMPGGSGIGVLEQVKAIQPGLKVIMLTAFPYSQYRDKCLSAGADYFFDKTNEFNRVTQVLIELLAEKDTSLTF